MAFVGSLFIAALAYVAGIQQYTIYGHLFSLGCLLLGAVVWFSMKSFAGGLCATILALVGLGMGLVTVPMVALFTAGWIVVAWGIK